MSYPAGEIEANGQQVPVQVNDDGQFHADFGGKRYTAPTKDKLAPKLRAASKAHAVEVAVPFIHDRGRGIVRGVATGLHSGNGNLLVRWPNGEKAQLTNFAAYPGTRCDLLADMPDDQIARWTELRKAVDDANTALYEFTKQWTLDPKAAVRAEIDKATKEAEGNA